RQFDRARRYAEAVGARYVVPIAGPPCFLDADLFELNDFDSAETNIFPDQTVFLDYLADRGIEGRLVVPGSVLTVAGGGCDVTHPGEDALGPFTDKQAYLEEYAARERPGIERRKADRAALPHTPDLLRYLKGWWEPLLEAADQICAGVGGPVLLDLGDERIVIDFPARAVRRPVEGEKYRYQYDIARDLVEAVLHTGETDWVNSLFLSIRFGARRIGQYNEFIYTFFKCLSPERLQYADGWYSESSGVTEMFRLDGWRVQRRCPHLKADLTRFGTLEGDNVLACQMHGFRFDLETGQCLTSEGYHLTSERVAADPAASSP